MSANPYPSIPSGGSHEIYVNKHQAISMFRASPWVTYEPTTSQSLDTHDMDQDVDMDAPQISTLRDEESPPPQQPKASTSGRKTKTTTHKPPPVWPRPRRKEINTDEEYDEVEEEEDQLIDDDDEPTNPVSASAPVKPSASADASKRKASNKRKPRKSEKRIAEDERKAQEKVMSSVQDLGPTMTWFEATPSEHPDDAGLDRSASISTPVGGDISKMGTPKRAAKPAVPRPAKKLPTKLKAVPVVPALPDDPGAVSEGSPTSKQSGYECLPATIGGYTGTAASSPVTAHFEAHSPEPEPEAEPNGSLASVPLTEETNLENVPLPQYPLPTKPFPVQPPPKIATGFAPVLPLDRSGKQVRHWRVAQREIRGIAGGRWFARSWVGQKESQYAASLPRPGEERIPGVAIPRLAGVSISAPLTGKGSGKGKAKAMSSLAASAAPSRSGSSIPDVPQTNPRPQTKMRTIIAPPAAGD
ncbi:hypothetical protein H0H81_005932 [Sphagnurus paluster]|uniref:Uncharacterized protein n=1 Tax=Sphagnurus paluster TaxID=117069 RepID=A0A9P7GSJ2_9AGAR|nr:hypothetical protein H0H81_005932 [Sphagnurus paluster]